MAAEGSISIDHSIDCNFVNAFHSWKSVRDVQDLQAACVWIEVHYKSLEVYELCDPMNTSHGHLDLRRTFLGWGPTKRVFPSPSRSLCTVEEGERHVFQSAECVSR